MTDKIYKDYLLTKNVLVNEHSISESDEDRALILMRLRNDYGVEITEGYEHINRYTYGVLEETIGYKNVPDAFYRNFPHDVKKLSEEQLLIDQMVHYMVTYGFGVFSDPGHSIYEDETVRPMLLETGEIKKFKIVDVATALSLIKESCIAILSGTRPLNNTMYNLIKEVYEDIGFTFNEVFTNIASKNTAMRLLKDFNDYRFARFLSISDVPKFVETIADDLGQRMNKISLPNSYRKIITKVLDYLLEDEKAVQESIRECCEKKKVWCGLLHHIHYKPKTSAATQFVNVMRGKENLSVLSQTEKLINSGYPEFAAGMMKAYKGTGHVLRNLNYLLSRCETEESVSKVFGAIKGSFNPVIALQLFNEYSLNKDGVIERSFSFTKHGKVKTHKETLAERFKRKSFVTADIKKLAMTELHSIIVEKYQGAVKGSVYVDEKMKHIALPIYESASSMGIGSLPTGSRIPLNGKDVRAFTYWEKVNDIDLACFGIDKDGKREEFSWRNMYGKQSEELMFSGDETSGYNGGSEYFDIKLDKFKENHPNTKYLVFTDSVFSGINFDQCFCKAGFMLREDLDAGEVYEPKTVNTSYTITSASTMAYLFAIDLETEELVWLNLDMNSVSRVAGIHDMSFLDKYIYLINSMTLYDFFTTAAETLTENSEDADLIVSDDIEGDNVIHSCDIDKLIALINGNFDIVNNAE